MKSNHWVRFPTWDLIRCNFDKYHSTMKCYRAGYVLYNNEESDTIELVEHDDGTYSVLITDGPTMKSGEVKNEDVIEDIHHGFDFTEAHNNFDALCDHEI